MTQDFSWNTSNKALEGRRGESSLSVTWITHQHDPESAKWIPCLLDDLTIDHSFNPLTNFFNCWALLKI
jgi:hypothetical protein